METWRLLSILWTVLQGTTSSTVMDTDPLEPRPLLHTSLAEVQFDAIYENLEFFGQLLTDRINHLGTYLVILFKSKDCILLFYFVFGGRELSTL